MKNLLILSLFLIGCSVQKQDFEIFTDTTENILKIPVTYGEKNINNDPGSRYAFRVVYSVPLLNIKKGDRIFVTMQGEATNDANRALGAKYMYNVLIGSFVSLGVSESDSTQKKQIIKASGVNTDPERHHEKIIDVGWHTFDQDYASVFVNSVWYSASTAARKGNWIDVETYGRMDVVLWRN